MSKEDELLKSQKKGRGHILQDLLSSTVLIHRSNFDPSRQDDNFPLKTEEDNSPPELLTSSCSICTESTNLRPLAVQEMEILAKFVLNQEQISLIFQTDHHPAIFCCKICSSAILSLAKLSTQIENITISLRAVISSRNGLFNKGRNEPAKITAAFKIAADSIANDQMLTGCLEEEEDFKISELSYQAAANIGRPPVKISNNEDNLQLPGGLEDEQEFAIKVEPVYDDDYISENDDQDSNLVNSEGEDLSKFTCTICQPNVSFERNYSLQRHLRTAKIHADLTEADIAALVKKAKRYRRPLPPKRKPVSCPHCDQRFTSYRGMYRHKRSSHDDLQRKCALCSHHVTSLIALQMHMRRHHKVPVSRPEGLYSCDMCARTFAKLIHRNQHVERVHFPDKTSCPYGCQVKIDSEADWVTHLEGCDSPKMSTESDLVCQYCPAVLRNVLLQIEHRLRVHPENMYPCSLCGQSFTTQTILSGHRCAITAPTTTGEGDVPNSWEAGVDTEAKFVCKMCQPNVTFGTYLGLKNHMRNKNIHPDFQISAQKEWECVKCGIKFGKKDNFIRHMKNKNIHPDEVISCSFMYGPITTEKRPDPPRPPPKPAQPVACITCGQTFPSKTRLLQHRFQVHPRAGRKCTLCPRLFPRVSMLQAHMRQSHSVPRAAKPKTERHPCPMCSTLFQWKPSMHRHVELVHFPDKTSCPSGCGTKIDSEADWVTHLVGCDSPKMA
ncbi:zinc finger protein 16 isoform X2 [Folsomia candida]|uniref:zinc finger protein 16 isoform X2 n=1 Tax=Folsomia candida TaxID=158441 RepID=UPI001604C168|nr:zinc finger protein 16 isoform X2 [Folsomia candida]